MDKKYKLEIVGITFNQIESGVYALILQQCGTTRRIPIIIGFPEAQAIQCKLQEVATPRPLTHDTMAAALKAFGIYLDKVMIKRLPTGVFAADLHFTDGVDEKVIDARSSDAIALAIRVGAPIYTTEEVLRESGFDSEDSPGGISENPEDADDVKIDTHDLSVLSLEQLSEAMIKAAEKEDYEEAARIKNEINRRGDKSA
ncbi:MAG: bifunctional nuclease family protein [Muribaculaceae bacterium]|nr:bifunctional nuclease family protein [Muribaculaceae bacterium]